MESTPPDESRGGGNGVPAPVPFDRHCLALADRILALLDEAGLRQGDLSYVLEAVSFLAGARQRARERTDVTELQ
jgi:hypothetical protein